MMVRLQGDKILLVEIHSIQLMSRKKDLEKHGYKVLVATTCEEALQTIEIAPGIGLILMDSDIGDGISGAPFTEHVQKKHNLPVVFLTSHTDPEILKKIERITPYGFVTRGSDSSQLDISIKMALRLFEANENSKKVLDESKQAHEDLQLNEHRYRSIIVNADSLIFTLSTDGLFTYVCPQWLEFMGEPAEEALGKPFEPYVHPDDVHLCRGFLNRVLTTDEKQGSIEYRVRRKDGSWRWHVANGSAIKDSNGNVKEYIGIARDVTGEHELRNNLELSEKKYRMLFENMNAGFALHDMIYDEDGNPVDYRFIELNPMFEKLTGGKAELYVGKTVKELLPDTEQYWIDTYGRVAKTGEPMSYQNYSKEFDKHFDTYVFSPAKDQFAVFFVDITERKRAEEESKELSEEYETLFQSTQDAVFLVKVVDNETFQFIRNNKAHAQATGLKTEDFCGKTPQELLGEELGESVVSKYSRCVQEKKSIQYEETLDLPGGLKTWLTVLNPVFENDTVVRIVGSARDITERKRASDALEKLLEEKNILLSEIHHRVKNNMAIISSLITLQTDYFDNKSPDYLLLDIRARIDSMALVHEMVYDQKNFAGINFTSLLKRLVDHLRNIYQPKDKNISVKIRSDDAFFDMSKSVPLTLLICEMLTNAWKHAFTGRRAGIIELELKKSENEHYLVIQDDGVGVADMDQIHNANSLGWLIINGLANQLGGVLSFPSPKGGGFRVEIRFPGKPSST